MKVARLVKRGLRLVTVPGEFLATGIRSTFAAAVAASNSVRSADAGWDLMFGGPVM